MTPCVACRTRRNSCRCQIESTNLNKKKAIDIIICNQFCPSSSVHSLLSLNNMLQDRCPAHHCSLTLSPVTPSSLQALWLTKISFFLDKNIQIAAAVTLPRHVWNSLLRGTLGIVKKFGKIEYSTKARLILMMVILML
mmetsp:Transcript_56136/g.117414  ORF Transcript_56136/g.117414 Transcript_56136/m.117414 type:complete len:138 (-) Transcript_56136:365-778(-)